MQVMQRKTGASIAGQRQRCPAHPYSLAKSCSRFSANSPSSPRSRINPAASGMASHQAVPVALHTAGPFAGAANHLPMCFSTKHASTASISGRRVEDSR